MNENIIDIRYSSDYNYSYVNLNDEIIFKHKDKSEIDLFIAKLKIWMTANNIEYVKR